MRPTHDRPRRKRPGATPGTTRGRAGPALSICALLVAACGPGHEEPAAEHEPSPQIQALLGGGRDAVTLPFPDGDTLRLSDDVLEFYRARGHEAVWTDRDGFLPRGEAMVARLDAAEAEGLVGERYHRHQIQGLRDRIASLADDGVAVGDLLGTLDLLLSESFVRYTTDLRRGTLDPEEAGIDWQIEREDATDAAFLNALVEGDDLDAALDSVRPAVPFYDRLRDALARYRDVAAAGGWPALDDGEVLEEGVRDPRVVRLRQRLEAERHPEETRLARAGDRPDVYDASLARAVEHFQERHGIEKDGRVGGSTLRALNVPVEERIATLELNLDRWRWMPRDLGDHYVLVNVAGFEMAVMRDDRPELTMAVVVGQAGWETPIFRDTMEYVVVNPYWNVPSSIAEAEVLPAVRRDPGYLARNRFEVVDGEGRAVDAHAVDLSSPQYRFRQRPGGANALGMVKFLFPNDHDVYLHDSPADHLFSRAGRAFSHGCIRVERPEELARYVLEHGAGRSPSDWGALRASGEEEWVTLEEKLPVYVLYFTAWVDEDGTTSFYGDVYGRDERVRRMAGDRLDETQRPAAAGERASARARPRPDGR